MALRARVIVTHEVGLNDQAAASAEMSLTSVFRAKGNNDAMKRELSLVQVERESLAARAI